MSIVENEQLTPKEHMLLEAERDEARLAREHAVTMKRLDIELAKLEAKWNSWLKIPMTIIRLPISFVLAIGYIAAVIRKQEPSERFWAYFK